MSHPIFHAMSSVRFFGGSVDDYLAIHGWLDQSKSFMADYRHRALRHHSQGIFEAERVFGVAIVNSEGKTVGVRMVAEQHVKEDLGGRIPSVAEWLSRLKPEVWMSRGYRIDPSP